MNLRNITLITSISLFLTLTSCSGVRDYRTDQERAQGIVLSEEVIEIRKHNERETREAWRREEEEKRFRFILQRCHGLIAECIR